MMVDHTLISTRTTIIKVNSYGLVTRISTSLTMTRIDMSVSGVWDCFNTFNYVYAGKYTSQSLTSFLDWSCDTMLIFFVYIVMWVHCSILEITTIPSRSSLHFSLLQKYYSFFVIYLYRHYSDFEGKKMTHSWASWV